MERNFTLILAFCASFLFAQKIKIVDSETSTPISDARIIFDNKIYYTNDEGFSLLPDASKDLDISAYGYETLSKQKAEAIIKLKPRYNSIDEVKIVSIDFQKTLKEVLRKYEDVYYNKPAIYDVTIKQKLLENNNLKLLMIADGKFWSRDGQFNAKTAHNNYDDFVQLQIDQLRYLKSTPYENKFREKKPPMTYDTVGNLFLNYELWRTIRLTNNKNAKLSGKLLYENGDEQEIFYTIKTDSSYVYQGNITYNKKDKAITHFELDFTQSKSKPKIVKDENGNEFKIQLGDGNFSFDYYKKNGKYFPSKIKLSTKGFRSYTDTQSYDFASSREFIFKSVMETDKKGLESPVKINQAYWRNLKPSDNKGDILLTKEEQDFVNNKDN